MDGGQKPHILLSSLESKARVVGLGGGNAQNVIRSQCRALMIGIDALIKETPQRPLTLSATQGDSEKTQL